MNMEKRIRNPAMDILRCFALLCVISLHFFKYCGFYYRIIVGPRMYIMTLLRSASMVAVPLFLMLSGYLLKNKQPTRTYYAKLMKTLIIYILASICCYLHMYAVKNEPVVAGTFSELLSMILDFKAVPYAWYMEMYIGLFLLIPYLNTLYNNLATQKHKQLLLLILLVMTALPKVTNGSGAILPDWWLFLYPITYYFLGSYIREYPWKPKYLTGFACTAAVVLIVGIINIFISHNTSFILGPWQDEESLLNVIQSVFVFNFLSQRRYDKMPLRAANLFARLSDLCLGAYLVSWIFDNVFYNLLNQIQPVVAYTLEYYPVVVLSVFICSLALSAVLNLVYQLLAKLIRTVLPQRAASV